MRSIANDLTPPERWTETSDDSRLGPGDWGYVGAQTGYLTHDIHRYSSKFIPQIARRCVESLSKPGELVLDPFCGSGTTLLEAALASRRSLGIDINPLACLLTRVKTTTIPAEALGRELSGHVDWVRAWTAYAREGQLAFASAAIPAFHHRYASQLMKWFQPTVLSELWAIYSAIRLVAWGPIRDLCLVSFSDVLRRLSNAHSAYPNVMFDRDAPTKTHAAEAYLRRLEQNRRAIEALVAHPQLSRWRPSVVEGEAQALPVADSSVDLIVTHPPYMASVPYAEYLLLSLLWLEIDPRDLDGRLLGGRRNRRDVTERFASGMTTSFREMRRVLRRGSHAVVVIGNPVVRGRLIDLRTSFGEMARACGLTLLESIVRSKTNMRANRMQEEFILVFGRE